MLDYTEDDFEDVFPLVFQVCSYFSISLAFVNLYVKADLHKLN